MGSLPALGQTVGVSSVTKAPGEKVMLEVTANSQAGRAPVALSWVMIFPVQVMDMDPRSPETGTAAIKSGKSLECTARKPYAYMCTLSGGQKPIADGQIAIFYFQIKTTAEPKITKLRIENAEATTMDSERWTLNDTEAIVVIK